MAVDTDVDPYIIFYEKLSKLPNQRILELGTRRVEGNPSTVRRHLAHPSSTYIASDFAAGDDVDVVADAHRLTDTFERNSFDLIWACSVFEHLARPWIVAKEMAAVTKPGGSIFVHTHQAFPLHSFPYDYFRFSREALELLFVDAGMKVLGSGYQFPAKITADQLPGLENAPAWLNVVIVCEKPLG